jgi:hypothetical protein
MGWRRIARSGHSLPVHEGDGEQGKGIPVFLLTGFPAGENRLLHKIMPRKV